jgi:hypothetical protein
MLGVSFPIIAWLPGQENERIIMGNSAATEELVSLDELDQLYRLEASESEPEDDEDDDGDDGEDDGEPGEIPHE